MRTHTRLASLLVFLSTLLGATGQEADAQDADDPQVIRQELTSVNNAWSKVRLAYDGATAEGILREDFYAALRDRRVTREDFIKTISTRSATSKLLRFDNPILTIIKGEKPDEWVALVLEKLEYERTAPDGTTSKTYHLWITRDGFQRMGPSEWKIIYTQEVMRETWTGGKRPPFPDWE